MINVTINRRRRVYVNFSRDIIPADIFLNMHMSAQVHTLIWAISCAGILLTLQFLTVDAVYSPLFRKYPIHMNMNAAYMK